jgi:hypothetical protein
LHGKATSYSDVRPRMADSNEPKKETVRITVSPQPSSTEAPAPSMRETVRIHLPTRPPANPPTAPIDSPSPVRTAAAAMPAPMPPPASPKKETARITVLPDPPSKPSVQMKKTQPLINLPAAQAPSPTVTVTPAPPPPVPQFQVDQIPMPLCWGLVAVSAAILILQIWNYLS